MICGGTGEAKEATAEVQELVNGLRAELEKEVSGGNMAPGNLEATHFKTQVWAKSPGAERFHKVVFQVVAGTNYFVRVRDTSGSHFHLRYYSSKSWDGIRFLLRIYKHFSGTVQLSGVKPAAEEEELVYFERS